MHDVRCSATISCMGTWGEGPFDNDDAADFLSGLRESDDIELELARYLRLATGEYVEAPAGASAVAAATVVALLCSDAVDSVVEPWTDAVANIRVKQTQAHALGLLASAAITRVTGTGSELADLWEDGDASQWRAFVGAVDTSLRGIGTPDYHDWAPYPGLVEAAAIALRDPDVALDELTSVVDLSNVRVFTLDREPTEDSRGLWQEVALVDGRRLVMWHGEDKSGRFDSMEFTSTVRTVPLSTITGQELRTTYQDIDGVRSLLAVELWLSTAIPDKTRAVSISETEWVVDDIYFAKSIVDGGLAQMERLLQFGRAVAQHV